MIEEYNFYIYEVIVDGKCCRYASPVSRDIVTEKGLIAEAIAGEVVGDGEQVSSENFKKNPAFIKFLQWSISRHVRECQPILQEAMRVGDGNVVIPDFRKPESDGSFPPEDIIGIVEVKKGEPIGFRGSPNYIPFTDKGFMKLDSFFMERYEADLLEHIDKNAQ